jgi:DNA-binding winged helix-turn-helix (wHTH) protein/TolB-like protein
VARSYRFGVFSFDADRLELTRDDRPIRLQPQPAQVLATLLAGAGRVVTRDELRHAVWRDDTFVDFERGLNFCVARIRVALGDDAASPRYIRTSPKKGYEFICPTTAVERADGTVEPAGEIVECAADVAVGSNPNVARAVRRGSPAALIAAAACGAVLAVVVTTVYRGAAVGQSRGASALASRPIVAVARFDNETGDPALTRFSDYLTDSLVDELSTKGDGLFEVVGNAAILRQPRENRDLGAIGSSLGAGYVVLGQVQRDDGGLRVLGHLIRLPDQTHVSVSRTDNLANPVDHMLNVTNEIAARMAMRFLSRLADGPRSSSSSLSSSSPSSSSSSSSSRGPATR